MIEIKNEKIEIINILDFFFNLNINIYIVTVVRTKYKLSAPAHPLNILISESPINKLLPFNIGNFPKAIKENQVKYLVKGNRKELTLG